MTVAHIKGKVSGSEETKQLLCDSSGKLLVGGISLSGSTLEMENVNQGDAGTQDEAWFVRISNGTQVLGTGSSAPIWITGSVTTAGSAGTVTITGSVGVAQTSINNFPATQSVSRTITRSTASALFTSVTLPLSSTFTGSLEFDLTNYNTFTLFTHFTPANTTSSLMFAVELHDGTSYSKIGIFNGSSLTAGAGQFAASGSAMMAVIPAGAISGESQSRNWTFDAYASTKLRVSCSDGGGNAGSTLTLRCIGAVK